MTNVILLNLGYFLVFLTLVIRNILWLRITITAVQNFDAGYGRETHKIKMKHE